MKSSSTTFTATIFVGRRVRRTSEVLPEEVAIRVVQEYCDSVGWCVTVTPTLFVYKNGSEPGFAIGVINYPRFPSSFDELERRTLELAERLQVALQQLRVSVVFPDRTVMLTDEDGVAAAGE